MNSPLLTLDLETKSILKKLEIEKEDNLTIRW